MAKRKGHLKDLRRMLAVECPEAEITPTNGNHYRIKLPNGRFVTASQSPCDYRALLNVRAQVRRELRR